MAKDAKPLSELFERVDKKIALLKYAEEPSSLLSEIVIELYEIVKRLSCMTKEED